MKMYCVSKATDEVKQECMASAMQMYMGPDRAQAILVASTLGEPVNYGPNTKYPALYSVLPIPKARTVVRYYKAGDVWYTIEEFEQEETK